MSGTRETALSLTWQPLRTTKRRQLFFKIRRRHGSVVDEEGSRLDEPRTQPWLLFHDAYSVQHISTPGVRLFRLARHSAQILEAQVRYRIDVLSKSRPPSEA